MSLSEYLERHYAQPTAKAYRREIEIYLGNCPQADKALHKDIVHYIGQLRKRYSNPRNLSRIVSSIKTYYNFLSFTGRRKDNPAKSIRLRDRPSRDIQLQDLFTKEELESLLNRNERYIPLEYRNKVLMSLLIYQALLPRELERLTTDDINLEQGTVYIKGSPKANARVLPLKPNQIMLIYQYLNEARPTLLKKKEQQEAEKALLISQRGNPETVESLISHVKRLKYRFKGRRLNMQTIRQSVIANLLKAGHDLSLVQAFAGHKYPGTTEKYRESNTEALKTAIQQYHPQR